MKLRLPEPVQFIIQTLSAHGYEGYAVGGCVRDAILGREPDDWDITTSARPQEIKKLFRRTVDTGIAHGTVTVLLHGEGFEVTTYRIDGAYEDNRHPKEVSFTGSLKEDLMRRDFTINAMAYNEESGLVDVFGGIEDLKRKRICCVGNPKERFGEDALRILRGVRFAAELGFELDEATSEAMKELAPTLEKISAERIQVELTKLLLSQNPDFFELLYTYGISKVVFPEYDTLEREQRKEVLRHLRGLEDRKTEAEDRAKLEGRAEMESPCAKNAGRRSPLLSFQRPEERALRLAAAFQFLGEEQAGKLLRRLKFDNKTIQNVRGILRFQNYEIKENPVEVRKAIYAMGGELFPLVLEFRYGRAENPKEAEHLEHIFHLWSDILEKGECVSLKGLAVTGSDLLASGCPKGQAVGRLLSELLQLVLEEPERNQRDWLLTEAGKRCKL